MDVQLSSALAATLGSVLAVEIPPHGRAFEVVIVTTDRGRFVIKRGVTPEAQAELVQESRVLQVLQGEQPFVAAPVGFDPGSESNQFAFTLIEGETLVEALQEADEAEKHVLIARCGAALRHIHGWTPLLPRPGDWLHRIVAREQERIGAQPAGTLMSGTHTRFDGHDAHALASALQAWQADIATDLVFGHGDYCLPNVLVRHGEVAGIIDWSRGGYIDRRFDLATGLFTLRYNLGNPTYLTTFLRAYGYAESIETLHMFEMLHALTCFW
jgi:kanamycin kinase/aminoglycoside 3'-phosphotransferase-2